jgi:hypothetical protein
LGKQLTACATRSSKRDANVYRCGLAVAARLLALLHHRRTPHHQAARRRGNYLRFCRRSYYVGSKSDMFCMVL